MAYRKIDVKMWDPDGDFMMLPAFQPSAKALWIWLLTGPETRGCPGLLRIGVAGAAEQLGWSTRDFLQAFSELERCGMVVADWPRRVVWLPKAMLYNQPPNHKVVLSWRNQISELPRKCPLSKKILESLRSSIREDFRSALPGPETFAETIEETVEDTVSDTVSDTGSEFGASSENREQRTESREEYISRASDEATEHVSSETESQKARAGSETESQKARSGEEDAPTRAAIEGIYEHYLSVMGLTSQLYRLTPRRRQKIRTRLTEYEPAYLKAAITACRESDFHMGSNPGGRLYNDLARHILPSEEKVEWWVVGRNGKNGG